MPDFRNELSGMAPDLFRIAIKRTGHYQDANDLVQQALLRAWEKQHLFKSGNQTAWVVRIMVNIFNDKYRKAKKQPEIPIEDEEFPIDLSPGTPPVDNGILTGIEIDDVNKELNKMGKKCKEILLLIAEENKYKEISEILDIPMGTVMNRLLRCRKQLSQALYGTSKYNEV